MGSVKQETVSGAKWLLLQKFTLQPLQFVYSMVLARLITPMEMGIVGLTTVFFAVAGTLASAGFGSALIRKIGRTEIDCDTAFWFNLGMSLLMSAVLFIAAPWFVDFYQQPELLWLTRCSAVMMFLVSTASVHWTLYTARRNFKVPAIIQTTSTIISMPVCLMLAYMGWGVWALMCGTLTSSLLSLVWVWIVSPWRPRWQFSCASFRELFGFGSKLAVAGIISTLFSNLRTFIVGKFYSPADLGMYVKGAHLGKMPPDLINGILGTVTYPILATLQNDRERLISVYRKYIRVATLPIAFGCMLVTALAEPMVRVCFGEQWMPCVIFVQLVSAAMMFDHVSTINLSLLQVLGRSDILLWLEIAKKTILLLLILYAATISVPAMCSVSLVYGQIAIFFNTYFTGKFLGLTWWRQQKDYMPYVIWALIACVPAWLCTMADWHAIVQLSVGGIVSSLLYFGGLHLLRDSAYAELYGMVRQKLRNRWLPPIKARSLQ